MRLNFKIAAVSLALCAALAGPCEAFADIPPVLLDSVRADLNNGRADHGLQALNDLLTQQPQNAEAYNLRCRIYLQEKHWDDAITACKAAVNLMPQNSDYNLWLARAMGEKADRVSFITAFKMAKQIHQEFETAAKLDPRNVPALSDLGEFYIDAPGIVGGGTDKAATVITQLDNIAPASAHYLRARLAENQKDYSTAEREYKAAIAASKDPASAWMDLASFYRRRQQWDDMTQAIHSGASADTQSSAALVDGASNLIRSGRDLSFARQLLERYLASSNKSEDAPAFRVHEQLGKLLSQLGDNQGSQVHMAAAQELAKNYQIGSHGATNTGR
jgi:tetratricopeptide (TPR) repeat protein